MNVRELELSGVYVLEPERHDDERGYFARTYCADELGKLGLDTRIAQINDSYNARKGTLRGMHFQRAPHAETKTVRCTRGALYDVVIDLRPASATFAKWVASELTVDNGHSMYVPQGCAHGFLTLEDDTAVEYVISTPYVAEAAAGVRYDDPAFGVTWPAAPTVISERDRSHPFVDLDTLGER